MAEASSPSGRPYPDPDVLPAPPSWNHPLYGWSVIGSFVLVSLILMTVLTPGYLISSRASKAVAALSAKDYEKATALLEYLTDREPKAYLRQKQLADCYRMLDRPGDALERYRLVAENYPKINVDAELGYVLSELGRESEAMNYFEKVLQTEPDQPGVNFHLGQIAADKGQWLDAAVRFQAAGADPYWDERATPLRQTVAKHVLGDTTVEAETFPAP